MGDWARIGGIAMIGTKIRELRTSRGMTLSQLAEMTDFTASYISQLERNIIQPSLSSLRRISEALGVPIYSFLTFEESQHVITRVDQRKKLELPNSSIIYEFVSPMAGDKSTMPKMEVIYFTLEPESWSSDEPLVHGADESVFILEGTMEVSLDDKTFELYEGDNIYIRESVPHRFYNPTHRVSRGLSVITPAIY